LLIRDAVAFRKAQDVLLGVADIIDDGQFESPAYQRLVSAVQNCRTSRRPIGLDLAVLLRHVLRNEEYRVPGSSPTFRLSSETWWPDDEALAQCGITARHVGGLRHITAEPYKPDWLADVPEHGLEFAAAGEAERRPKLQACGDPFLSGFTNFSSYQSLSQQQAVRGALITPPGAACVVSLPTGEGKSLVGQLLSQLVKRGLHNAGATIVIVPTVALALDQETACRKLGLPDVPRAYVGVTDGGQSQRNQSIYTAITAGTQGLCYVSPESACGPLRSAIVSAAKGGHLHALVIDEAHLVDGWGSGFRPEFQILAGLRQQCMAASPPGYELRTLLMSATITQSTVDAFARMFSLDRNGVEQPLGFVGGPRMRPEPEYWVAIASSREEQARRIIEALHFLPRPAIVYVTLQQHVAVWKRRLTAAGFARVGSMSGASTADERRELLDAWRHAKIDIVVGNSAFGLGIDYKHVRTVVHACLPETLDRLYQEVGRGGRDGRASISLLVPYASQSSNVPWEQRDDFDICHGIGARKIITVRVGLDRWKQMFMHKSTRVIEGAPGEVHRRFDVPVDVPPGLRPDQMDMANDESTAWNLRTLNLMASAGLLQLAGGPDTNSEVGHDGTPAGAGRERMTVRILDPGHLSEATWCRVVEPARAKLEWAASEGRNLLTAFVRSPHEGCISGLLVRQYTVSFDMQNGPVGSIVPESACGGCPWCRKHGKARVGGFDRALPFPWPSPRPSNSVSRLLAQNRRVVTVPSQVTARLRSDFLQTLRILASNGFVSLVIHEGAVVERTQPEFLQEMGKSLMYVEEKATAYRLPKGPRVTVAGPSSIDRLRVFTDHYTSDAPAIIFVPESHPDPGASGEGRLIERLPPGYVTTLSEFNRILPSTWLS